MIVKIFYKDDKKVASKVLQKMNLLQNVNKKHAHLIHLRKIQMILITSIDFESQFSPTLQTRCYVSLQNRMIYGQKYNYDFGYPRPERKNKK